MLKHHITIVFRQLSRNWLFSGINIIGLAVAMTCFLLIFKWVQDEYAFDRYHTEADRTYRLVVRDELATGTRHFANVPPALGTNLEDQYPEVEAKVRLRNFTDQVEYGEKRFEETGIYYADPELFTIFDFPWISGDPETSLDDPASIVISNRIAQKYFGEKNPIGESLIIDKSRYYTVKGVMEDFPYYSTLQIDFFIPIKALEQPSSQAIGPIIRLNSWGSFAYNTYIRLSEGTDPDQFKQKVGTIINDHLQTTEFFLELQPLKRIHLYELSGDPGRIVQVRMFILIGLFMLILAWVNFMNLSTARSVKRAKEMGLRRVVGAFRGNLIRQILRESVNIAIIAAVFAMILMELLKPLSIKMSGHALQFDYLSITDWGILILLILGSGFLAGIYPSLVFTSYSPKHLLRDNMVNGRGGAFRKVLVVFQFVIAVTLIICTLTVQSQLNYMVNKETGLNKKDLIYFTLNEQLKKNYSAWSMQLESNPYIESHTRTFQMPSNNHYSVNPIWEAQAVGQVYMMNLSIADFGYIKTFGMTLEEGRDFQNDFSTDSTAYIINRACADMIGKDKVLGMTIGHNNFRGPVIGILKNYHFQSLMKEIEPIALFINPRFYTMEAIRFKSGYEKEAMDFIRQTFSRICPDYIFSYTPFENDFTELYRNERSLGNQLLIFAILAIFIAALGLLGLATFMSQQNIKQIGIRKVLGASVHNLIFHFTIRFIIWVVIALILAFPLSYYFMYKWMEHYAYHSGLSWWIFMLAGLIALTISVLTISVQAWLAANRNPVLTLKNQ